MSLGKQAKTLSKGQIEATLGYLAKTRYPIRNRVIFLLSIKAGLRAKEIALLTWEMITDASGEIGKAIHLQDKASKGRSGRGYPAESGAAVHIGRLATSYSVNTIHVRDFDGTIETNISSGHRELVCAMVS